MSYSLICDGITDALRDQLEYLESIKYDILDAVNKFNEKIHELNDPLDDARNAVEEQVENVLSEITEVRSLIHQFTGSCLDGIFDAVSGIAVSLEDLIDRVLEPLISIINQIDVLDAVKVLSNTLGIGGLQIPNIIGLIDEKLGCLSDAECLSLDEMQQYIDYVNGFLTDVGLGDQGEYDIESFIDDAISGMGSIGDSIKANLLDINTRMENLKNDFLEIFRSIKKTTEHSASNVPEELY